MRLAVIKKTPPFHPMPLRMNRQPDGEEVGMDTDNARRLWAAVLERAVLDLQDAGTRAEAVEWINSRRRTVGSFHWVCQHLDMDPGSVKQALLGARSPLHLLLDRQPADTRHLTFPMR